ncbi:carbohydrate ABC transporter permease [Actinophytocola xanthii]|uniref:ABC transporter permease n=1 Tax=Actinophytocola xanthii TaxID=1912961 RepID=A0A1Q8CPT5_9PSEU|nr:sugar ABC transporter permease [Actinophytocola xanthii]OLF16361.1 ABC transporter permease [Actinophytocola xanthii]
MARRGDRGAARPGPALVPYLFLAPAIVLFTLFVLVPIGYTAYLSLHRVRVSGLGLGRGSRTQVFAGLDTYRQALGDPELWRGALRVLGYGALLVPTMLGLALLFALLLDRPRVRLARFSRISIFLPYAVPGVVASVLWGFLYLPALTPLPVPEGLLGPGLLFAVANIGLWGGVGFNMLVILTALRAVPPEVTESARLDGASELQIALRVKTPLVTPALIMAGLFTLIATLQVYTEPTTLAPLTNALPSTWTPLMKVYNDAFVRDDIHSAAATSVVLAAITLTFSLVFLRVVAGRAFAGERS